MKTGLIIGCFGQDGSYLSELLSERDYRVLGVDLVQREEYSGSFVPLDITDRTAVFRLISQEHPEEIYHLAAYHHSAQERDYAGSSLVEQSLLVNSISLDHVLDAISKTSPHTRLFYAASSRIFGSPRESPQNEETRFEPRCAYGISKVAGIHLCRMYREIKGVFAATGILYNHESPRRSPSFVTRKLTQAAAKAYCGLDGSVELQSLTSRVDWGWAPDYVEAMTAILQLQQPEDFVIGTGETYSVGDFARLAFNHVRLQASDFVKVRSGFPEPLTNPLLCGNSLKLKRMSGWEPRRNVPQIVHAMVEADLHLIHRNKPS